MTTTFTPVRSDLETLTGLEVIKGIAILILANNEADVIGETIRSVRLALGPHDAVIVIADNCCDDTTERALEAGALVYQRFTDSPDGKGTALKWFIDQAGSFLENYDLVVILDADNRVSSDFLRQVRAGYQENVVIQCFVQPVDVEGSTLGKLIALSEIHEQRTMDRIRSFFGWPVRLRGTGMVMTPAQLKVVEARVATEVEDIALSLLFVSGGIRVLQNDQAYVLDPKPLESALASRQRARWFRGQWVALWHYRREVWRLVLRGPSGWSLLGSLFLKPRWLMDLILIVLAIVLTQFSWLLAFLALGKVFFDLACLGHTILTSEDRNGYLKAILHAPDFLLMWLRGILLAFKKNPWLRARP